MTMLFMSMILTFSLLACGSNDVRNGSKNSSESTSALLKTGNILIAYFSVPEDVDINGVDSVAGASVVVKDGKKMGNTEYVAQLIQKTVGGDLFPIETVEEYPLDHDTLVEKEDLMDLAIARGGFRTMIVF